MPSLHVLSLSKRTYNTVNTISTSLHDKCGSKGAQSKDPNTSRGTKTDATNVTGQEPRNNPRNQRTLIKNIKNKTWSPEKHSDNRPSVGSNTQHFPISWVTKRNRILPSARVYGQSTPPPNTLKDITRTVSDRHNTHVTIKT